MGKLRESSGNPNALLLKSIFLLIENGISFPAARMDVRVCGNDASCQSVEPTDTNV